ncbi:hypothetical protein JCM8097_001014 [Rhodosporidiobolus ruineniae]
MLFASSSSTASRSRSLLPFVFLAALLTLVHTTAALPAKRSTAFEPLFRPASSSVGPQRSIERLRLRRAIDGVFGRRATPTIDKRGGDPVRNPKVKRAVLAPNPKAKRDTSSSVLNKRALERRELGLPAIVANPKAKRSLAPSSPSSPVNLRRRFLGLPAVVNNPKKRSLDLKKRDIVEASVSVTPSAAKPPTRGVFDALRQYLAASSSAVSSTWTATQVQRRAAVATPSSVRIGVVKIVPNPKSPSFAISSSSSVASTSFVAAPTTVTASATSTRAATSTTTTRATTTSRSTTTSRATTTTRASSTTTRTTTTTSPAATSTGWPAHGGQIAGGYYPDWVEDVMPPEAINFKEFDLINYSFAIPGSDYKVTLGSGDILKRVVKYAHGNDTKVLIAIGGWSDSTYFSGAVATASRRATFVQSIVDLVNTYGVDGVDIDWEYPGTQGDSGNQISTKDTANLLTFLKALRAALPNARLSTCTTQQTYVGANGSPIGDVSAYADVLDNILVMNYDVWGASSTPGANAPLTDACSGSLQPTANMESAIEQWTAAGMPASKILMGVPAYGYISSSTATSLIHKRDNIPTTGLSNRHLANIVHEERNWSAGHRWYVEGQRAAAARRRLRRAAKRELRKQQTEELAKRGSVIVCPNNHSGKPCAGVTGQNISEINWNPLGSSGGSGSGNGTTGGDGVFNPGTGPGKVGKGDLSGLEGNQIQFVDLINYGVIVKDDDLDWVGTNGYTRAWDSCSSTPYLYDTSRKVVITYDDPESLGLKGQLANQKGIAGLAMWDISGDTKDFQLTQSWRSAMGLDPL